MKFLISLIFLIFVELKISAYVYAELVSMFSRDAAFWISWGYFLLTIYMASQIIKGSGFSHLQKYRDNLSGSAGENNELFDGARRVVAAILLFTPGYLTDLFGFLIFLSDSFAKKVFGFVSQRLMQNFVKGAQRNSGTFYYSYTERRTQRAEPRKNQDPNVLDAEYTEVHERKIDS